jgi:hypothetical protein
MIIAFDIPHCLLKQKPFGYGYEKNGMRLILLLPGFRQ